MRFNDSFIDNSDNKPSYSAPEAAVLILQGRTAFLESSDDEEGGIDDWGRDDPMHF